MSALKISKKTSLIAVAVSVVALSFVSSANAYHHKCHHGYSHHYKACSMKKWKYTPVAVCETSTHISMTPYVCCKLKNKDGSYAWKNNWVSGSCMSANSYARGSRGCTEASFVYGSSAPIVGSCQYSFSTGKYF